MLNTLSFLVEWVTSQFKDYFPSWGEVGLCRKGLEANRTGNSIAEGPFTRNEVSRITTDEKDRSNNGALVVKEVAMDIGNVEDTLSYGNVSYEISEDPFCVSDDGKCTQYQHPSKHFGTEAATTMPNETISTVVVPSGMMPLRELDEEVFSHIEPMHELIKLRLVSRTWKEAISSRSFFEKRLRVLGRTTEGTFGPSFFTTDDSGDWHWLGFNRDLNKWVTLPSLNFARNLLPSLDPDIFKDHMVAAADGLLCINVANSPSPQKLVICNPLTQKVKALPPMNFPRQPVLMHLQSVDKVHYKVVVAGSAAIGTEELSLITEEYSSRTGTWTRPSNSDLRCARFGLNEYHNGATYKAGDKEYLLCVAILSSGMRGILVYDLELHTWFQDASSQSEIPLVMVGDTETDAAVNLATTQLVECAGKVYVFTEQEVGRDVFLCIHEFQWTGSMALWSEVMKRKRLAGRGLSSYPENTCVALSEHELCLFNTVEHTMELVDVRNSPARLLPLNVPSPLFASPSSSSSFCFPTGRCRFHTLNPINFTFQPTFGRHV
uniref:F-box domain-containing protein n=1 Tax=Physcomitrium patens TaxID=3218 RepID=A9T1B7_PHYPA|nr:hypothetical protein PHYPA_030124 [Physcomitrium patens]